MLICRYLMVCLGMLVAGCAFAAPRLAPTPVFGRLGVADGLPSTVVYKIVQDRDGFIWFGTQDGLARYDGVGFRIWRNDPLDTHSLAGNQISVLFVDSSNRLWVGCDDAGLSVLDGRGGGFRRLRHDASDPASLPSDDVWAITEDRDGAIWMGTYSGGLARLRADGQHFDVLRKRDPDKPSDSGLGSNTVLSLLPTESGALWIGTDAGIDRRETDGRIVHVGLDEYIAPGRPLHVLSIAVDGDGVIAATGAGLLRIDSQLKATRLDSGAGIRKLYGFAQSKDGDLWLATRHGTVRRQRDGSESSYPSQAMLPGGLPGEALSDVLADAAGGIWFAAVDGGVAHLPPQWRRFSQFRELPGTDSGLFHGRVAGMGFSADGTLWLVNASDGLDRLDPATGRVEHLNKFTRGEDIRLRMVFEDRRGRLWLGQQRGLRLIDPSTDSVRDFPVVADQPDALPAARITQFAEAPDTLWISVPSFGLLRIDPDSLVISRIEPGDATGLRSSDISQMTLSPTGELWVAHDQGMDRYDATKQHFVAQSTIPAKRVHAFDFAADGSLWLHRFGALEHYAVDRDSVRLLERLDAAAGWPALSAGGLVVDAKRRLWLTTPRGLYRVDPTGPVSIRHYDASDGLLSPEFVDGTLHLRGDGALFAATQSGVLALDTLRADDARIASVVQWTTINVRRDDARVEFEPGALIDLRWNDRDLRVQARALEFAGQKRYQFRLDPIDRDWSEPAERGEREFSQLRAGDYRLHMRVSIDGSTAIESLLPLQVHVEPPPWASKAAYAAYAFALFSLGAISLLAWRRRIARRYELDLARQRRMLAEQASAAKSDFLAHMGHEIRTPMTGLLGMTELLVRSPLDERQRNYAAAIRSSGEQMLRLVNDALDLARIEAGRLELDDEAFDPGALTREVGTIGIALAERKGIAFEWEYVEKDVPRQVRGDARRIRQILLNLISNAVKFTSRGGVALRLERHADSGLRWSVRDSGPGISPELRKRLFRRYEQGDRGRRAGGSGLGLAICRELTELMQGAITLEDAPGGGCLFHVDLRLQIVEENPASISEDRRAEKVDRYGAAILDLLLVENDAHSASDLTILLQALGHRVRLAANGLAALSELAAQRPDIALVALEMPGIDGLQVARMWRKRETEQDLLRLPLIALSSLAGSAGDTEARSAGMDHLLRKPVDSASVSAILQQHAR
ncbi:MAG: two-component regulator propeller domain-containing protein [Tahibacter sp.]